MQKIILNKAWKNHPKGTELSVTPRVLEVIKAAGAADHLVKVTFTKDVEKAAEKAHKKKTSSSRGKRAQKAK